MKISRGFSMFIHAGLLVLAPSIFENNVHAAEKPNIVLILADDLGYGDLSCYGARDLRSPAIDGLVKAGMRFDSFYANCPVCSPTRAALLSGKYPELVGVPGVIRTHRSNNWGYLDPRSVLLPALLKQAGWHTAMVGKWHLGLESPNTPSERGFDHFHGFLGDMMDDYFKHRRHGINYMRRNDKEIDPKGHATDLFTQWAVEYIRQQAKTKRPFFLYLAYNAPHTPIQPPQDWLQKVKAREQGITDRRARLVALIEHMDDGVGKVVRALKETGVYENTIVLFTSDNGGQLNVGASNSTWRGGKQEMYEGGLRVPMCAVWPGRIKPNSRSERIALTMDLFQTLCEAAGVKVDNSIDGKSILPTLLGKKQKAIQRDLAWTRREGGNRYMGKTIWAFRRGDWKLLQNSPTAPFELYNLREDPGESTNRAGKDRKTYDELARGLREHIQRGGAVPWQKPR